MGKHFDFPTKIQSLNLNMTEEEKARLSAKIEQAFTEYTGGWYQELRVRLTKVLNNPQEVEKRIAEEKREHFSYNLNGRISELVNNFRLWWPKGRRREYIVKMKGEYQAKAQQLVADLDEIIFKKGYQDAPILRDCEEFTEEAWAERFLVIADVFLEMRAKGYSLKELR